MTAKRLAHDVEAADSAAYLVPNEWIEAVLAKCRAAPVRNFLCLTKFPKRMAEFDVPENVCMGATVNLQVTATGEAFADVKSKVRWLSCEALIEPLRFRHLDRFNWIVIGGASKIRPRPRRFFLPERRRAMIAVIAGIDRRSSSVGTEYVRRHPRLAFGAQGLRA